MTYKINDFAIFFSGQTLEGAIDDNIRLFVPLCRVDRLTADKGQFGDKINPCNERSDMSNV